jgi:hypothetical protein
MLWKTYAAETKKQEITYYIPKNLQASTETSHPPSVPPGVSRMTFRTSNVTLRESPLILRESNETLRESNSPAVDQIFAFTASQAKKSEETFACLSRTQIN